MSDPTDGGTAWSLDPLGPYDIWTGAGYVTVTGDPVIGPYSSLEGHQTVGLPECSLGEIAEVTNPSAEGYNRYTVVPDNYLNWADCPMPPAKLTFEIADGAGYFKAADKAAIYWNSYDGYYNPFYAIEVPASEEIPPMISNGGYDWDSWGWTLNGGPSASAMGPYYFWDLLNNPGTGIVPSADPAVHPTKVQVYTDNHGEAMVYLNGNWNLDPPVLLSALGYGDYVDSTTAFAVADYPYLRGKAPAIYSLDVSVDWYWGKDIVILVEQVKDEAGNPDPLRKVVWVLVSDRDEFPALNETIVWRITGDNGGIDTIKSPSMPGWVGFGYDADLQGWLQKDSDQVATTRTVSADTALPWAVLNLPLQKTETIGDHLGDLFGLDSIFPDHGYAVAAVVIKGLGGGTIQLNVSLDERLQINGETGEGWIDRNAVSAGQVNKLDFTDYTVGSLLDDPCDPVEQLTAGWNLISFKSGNQSVAIAIDSIKADVVSIWAFDNAAKSWKAYSPTAPSWANDLKGMDTATPYWIQVDKDLTWYY
jgi:hypothetical protein